MQQKGGPQYGALAGEMGHGGGDAATDPRSSQNQKQQLKLGDPEEAEAEAASPISSRPPSVVHNSRAVNLEEILPMPITGGLPEEDALACYEADRGGGGGASGGNRWPRQETLALLKIRSEMDAAFRDATLKGPLWEDVSRKLAELGYKRSAKKCREKFENVHKYYKRTKEGRAGRQDGKNYKFFSQLEALDNSSNVNFNVSNSTTNIFISSQQPVAPPPVSFMPVVSVSAVGIPHSTPTTASAGIRFSSDSTSYSSSSSGSEELDEEEVAAAMEVEGKLGLGGHRKRKRSGSSKQGMMEFFEGLMKQVIQRQEVIQQRFFEAIEKREQDRMIREEAWKRQEMARAAREYELLAQERAMSASRDAAIVAFLQKITGQNIQLPTLVTVNPVSQPPSIPVPPPSTMLQPPVGPPPPPSQPQQHHPHPHHHQIQQQQQHQQYQQLQSHQHRPQSFQITHHQLPVSSELVAAVPEQKLSLQEIGEGVSQETASSRWPKAEVLALIKLRSGLESRYQEAGPKGPLWEEISAGMQRMGYKRTAKRCKEKWENINKYFKKVKESNRKRPEDAKTCPYFGELDALYRNKIIVTSGTGGGSNSGSIQHMMPEQQQQQQRKESVTSIDPSPATSLQEGTDLPTTMPSLQTTKAENKGEGSLELQTSIEGLTATLFGEGITTSGSDTGVKKPEDILKEQQTQQRLVMDSDKAEETDSDNLDQEVNFEDGDDEEEEEEEEDEMKMAYKIEFQRQNASSSSGGGNEATTFLAMVQ